MRSGSLQDQLGTGRDAAAARHAVALRGHAMAKCVIDATANKTSQCVKKTPCLTLSKYLLSRDENLRHAVRTFFGPEKKIRIKKKGEGVGRTACPRVTACQRSASKWGGLGAHSSPTSAALTAGRGAL